MTGFKKCVLGEGLYQLLMEAIYESANPSIAIREQVSNAWDAISDFIKRLSKMITESQTPREKATLQKILAEVMRNKKVKVYTDSTVADPDIWIEDIGTGILDYEEFQVIGRKLEELTDPEHDRNRKEIGWWRIGRCLGLGISRKRTIYYHSMKLTLMDGKPMREAMIATMRFDESSKTIGFDDPIHPMDQMLIDHFGMLSILKEVTNAPSPQEIALSLGDWFANSIEETGMEIVVIDRSNLQEIQVKMSDSYLKRDQGKQYVLNLGNGEHARLRLTKVAKHRERELAGGNIEIIINHVKITSKHFLSWPARGRLNYDGKSLMPTPARDRIKAEGLWEKQIVPQIVDILDKDFPSNSNKKSADLNEKSLSKWLSDSIMQFYKDHPDKPNPMYPGSDELGIEGIPPLGDETQLLRKRDRVVDPDGINAVKKRLVPPPGQEQKQKKQKGTKKKPTTKKPPKKYKIVKGGYVIKIKTSDNDEHRDNVIPFLQPRALPFIEHDAPPCRINLVDRTLDIDILRDYPRFIFTKHRQNRMCVQHEMVKAIQRKSMGDPALTSGELDAYTTSDSIARGLMGE